MRKFFFLAALCCAMMAMATEGALNGKFSVSADKQVQFSQGNLQYCANQGVWLFADHQWYYVGGGTTPGNVDVPINPSQLSDNTLIDPDYDGMIDLFGWNTSDDPTRTSTVNTDYPSFFVDWGTNRIINGGNQPNLWRTLAKSEWVYLFHERANADRLFGLGVVNNVFGLILLPDDWQLPDGLVFTPSITQGLAWTNNAYYYNSKGNNYTHNFYSLSEWNTMQAAGAVFLPAAGNREGTVLYGVTSTAHYWSTMPEDENGASDLHFNGFEVKPRNYDSRAYGQSVRLVQDIDTEGIEEPTSDSSLKGRGKKVLRDGVLLIERNGRTYNACGQEVR